MNRTTRKSEPPTEPLLGRYFPYVLPDEDSEPAARYRRDLLRKLREQAKRRRSDSETLNHSERRLPNENFKTF